MIDIFSVHIRSAILDAVAAVQRGVGSAVDE